MNAIENKNIKMEKMKKKKKKEKKKEWTSNEETNLKIRVASY